MLALMLAAALAWSATVTDRVEIDSDGAFDEYEVIPAGEHGLVLIAESPSGEMSFTGYDQEFNERWTAFVDLPRAMVRFDVEVIDGALVLGMHERRDADLVLLHVDLSSGVVRELRLRMPYGPTRMTDLAIDGMDVYAAGRGRRRAVLVHHRLGTQTVGDLDTGRGIEVERLAVRATGGVDAVVTRTRKKHREVELLQIDDGAVQSRLMLDGGDGLNLLTAQRKPLEDGADLIVGTYALGRRGTGSQGVYVARFQGAEPEFVRTHSFTEFDNFFDYFKDKKQARVEARAQRLRDQGRDLALDYQLLVHDLIERDGDTLLVAEAFYPVYTTYTVPQTVIVNGVPTTTFVTHTVFVGWRFTHAVVAGLGANGDLLWDHSFPIQDVLSRRLDKQVRVTQADGRVSLLYTHESVVYSKVVDGNEVTRADSEAETVGAGEKVKNDWATDSAWWFDQTFVVWGVQKVKGEDGKRKVFWFAKASP